MTVTQIVLALILGPILVAAVVAVVKSELRIRRLKREIQAIEELRSKLWADRVNAARDRMEARETAFRNQDEAAYDWWLTGYGTFRGRSGHDIRRRPSTAWTIEAEDIDDLLEKL